MKKMLCLFLAAVLLLSLAACGSSPAGKPGSVETDPAKPGIESPAAENETPAPVYTLSDEVILDNDVCIFKITKVDPDDYFGFVLKCYFENKTEATSLYFTVDYPSINGYMVESYFSETVAAGKRSNTEISFSKTALADAGITSVDEIEFTLTARDSDNWLGDPLVDEAVTIHPTGKSAEEIKVPEKPSSDGGITVVSDGTCDVSVLSTYKNTVWDDWCLVFYLENRTDTVLNYSWEDVSVNGYMIDSLWSATVTPGKRMITTYGISKSTLEKIGISTPDEVEFALSVTERGNWTKDPYISSDFTIRPTGKSADEIVIPERPTRASEKVIVSDDTCSFVILEYYVDEIWGGSLSCWLENKTDEKLSFSWENVSVDGYMIDPYWMSNVAPGKRKMVSIAFSDTALRENGITEPTEIEFTLRVRKFDDWFSSDLINETQSYFPQS